LAIPEPQTRKPRAKAGLAALRLTIGQKLLSTEEKPEQQYHRDWYTQQPQQNSASHILASID
jgi:hypothetical protein